MHLLICRVHDGVGLQQARHPHSSLPCLPAKSEPRQLEWDHLERYLNKVGINIDPASDVQGGGDPADVLPQAADLLVQPGKKRLHELLEKGTEAEYPGTKTVVVPAMKLARRKSVPAPPPALAAEEAAVVADGPLKTMASAAASTAQAVVSTQSAASAAVLKQLFNKRPFCPCGTACAAAIDGAGPSRKRVGRLTSGVQEGGICCAEGCSKAWCCGVACFKKHQEDCRACSEVRCACTCTIQHTKTLQKGSIVQCICSTYTCLVPITILAISFVEKCNRWMMTCPLWQLLSKFQQIREC
jgi:hypothetical protein